MWVTVITADRKLQRVERPLPTCGPGEVLVRSAITGICGTDIELLHGTRPAKLTRYPVAPGHEWSGVVTGTGIAVTGVAQGDRVACEARFHCDACARCRAGQTNLCSAGYEELGFTRDGGLSEYVAVPTRLVHKLPEDLPLDAAALLEPAAVVVHAFLRCAPPPGSVVAVVGDGTIGQLAVQTARCWSAAAVSIVGAVPSRLAMARATGAAVAYDVREGAAESWFRETVAADGADLVIEAAGNPDAVGLALRMARPGGSVALIGAAGTDAAPCRLDSDVFVLNDLRVHGICGSVPAAWDLAIGLAATGRLSLGRLISHRYSVTEAAAAYRTVESRATGTMKVVLVHDWAAA